MKLICREQCVAPRPVKARGWALLTSILVMFMPKCALCWAMYMGFLSSVGIVVKYQPWFLPVAAILFTLTLIKLLVTAIRRKNFVSVVLALASAVLVFLERNEQGIDTAKIVAVILMAAAVTMDGVRRLLNMRAA